MGQYRSEVPRIVGVLKLTMGVQMYEPPRDRQEAEGLKQYMSQVRQELAVRLLARVYEEDETKPSKWWLSFTKRKFMGKAL